MQRTANPRTPVRFRPPPPLFSPDTPPIERSAGRPHRRGMPPVTRNLVIANGVMFLLTLAIGNALAVPLALWPLGGGFMPWQLVTYAFLHAGATHVLFNMIGVY